MCFYCFILSLYDRKGSRTQWLGNMKLFLLFHSINTFLKNPYYPLLTAHWLSYCIVLVEDWLCSSKPIQGPSSYWISSRSDIIITEDWLLPRGLRWTRSAVIQWLTHFSLCQSLTLTSTLSSRLPSWLPFSGLQPPLCCIPEGLSRHPIQKKDKLYLISKAACCYF